MSGVGEGLAILSLIIAVAENYKEACQQPYTRFKRFPKVVKRYLAHLDNQRAIYETHCELLLENALGDEESKEMLASPSDTRWQSDHFGEKVATLLGRRREACLKTVKVIETLLDETKKESTKLTKALEREQEVREHSISIRRLYPDVVK